MKHYAYNSPFNMIDTNGNKYVLTVEQDEMTEDPREWDNVCTMVCWHKEYRLGDNHNYDSPEEFLKDMVHKYVDEASIIKYATETEHDDVYAYQNNGQWIIRYKWLKSYDEYEANETEPCDAIIDELSNNTMLMLLQDKVCLVPLYLYDHGGITMSTGSFGDRWDSGQVGWAYITKEQAFKELCACVFDENGNPIKIEYKHEGHPSTYSYKTEPLTEEKWKARAEETIDAEVETYDQYLTGETYWYRLEKEVHYRNEKRCPHCNELISVDEGNEMEEVDSCGGFYGDCIEDNGILDQIGSDLSFVE